MTIRSRQLVTLAAAAGVALLVSTTASASGSSRPKTADLTGSQGVLAGVSAVSATDAWAVGQLPKRNNQKFSTLTEHWDGSAWSVVPGPSLGTENNWFRAVDAVTATDAWAVGAHGRIGRALIEHWDGTSWVQVACPDPAGWTEFMGVSALSASNAWAVGITEALGDGPDQTLVEHWDGSSWVRVPSPNPGNPATHYPRLFSVSAVGPDDIWAVGDVEYISGVQVLGNTLIEHWDGTTWSRVASPNPAGVTASLRSVSADSATDAWAVGSVYAPPDGRPKALIEHWDGTSWTRMPVGGGWLTSVSARSPADVWAAGEYARIWHWDGSSWTKAPKSPVLSRLYTTLNAVSARTTNDVWVVGDRNYRTAVADHWNGTTWTVF